jgi:hypothetical protein
MSYRRISSVILLLGAALPTRVSAHCDGLDGPVVKAAQAALEQNNLELVLIWVSEEYEPEVRSAFQRTLAVRSLSPEAMELADMYFFETVVRLHRLGEGAPYTGLKPAGRDLGPAIPAADLALETGDLTPLLELLSHELRAGLEAHFQEAVSAAGYVGSDVDAGRAFVEKYVTFIHYVERAYETARSDVHGHFPDASRSGHDDT